MAKGAIFCLSNFQRARRRGNLVATKSMSHAESTLENESKTKLFLVFAMIKSRVKNGKERDPAASTLVYILLQRD